MESGSEKGNNIDYTEISVAGATVKVRSAQIEGKLVVVTGKWLKIAAIKGEEWTEGEVVSFPEIFIGSLRKQEGLRADLFIFSQKPTDPAPRFPFFYELESVAAVPTLSYSEWWTKRVSTDLRCDVRKAAKHGVLVRPVEFNDDFVRGIVDIYDETPIRQGRPFWHYKKGFDAVKLANASYLDRSEFLGAYLGDELIGFLKIVHVGQLARLMQIIAKDAYRDKRPMNALLAKAIEICSAKGCSYLTYGKYRYAQGADSVTAFKHRNGFEEIMVPKYYVPLTVKGRLALQFRLQRGGRALLPEPVLRSLRRFRSSLYRHPMLVRKLT